MKRIPLKLIFNPNAGDPSAASTRVKDSVELLLRMGFDVDVVLSPRKRAEAAALRAVKQGFRLVVVAGGDGSIEAVGNALMGTDARLGILPLGTFNNIAKSLGIPNDLEAACLMIKEGPHRRMDVGQVKFGKTKHYFFEQVGVGLSAAVFPEVKDIHKLTMEGIGNVIKTVINYKPPRFRLVMDGESEIHAETLLVTVANTPAYGATFLEAPEASLKDGLLEIGLYPGFSKTDLAAFFASIMNGRQSNDERVQRYRAREVTILSDPIQPVVADSIPLGEGKVTAKILRKALKVIAPKEGGLAQDQIPAAQQMPAPAAGLVDKNIKDPRMPDIKLPGDVG